MSYNANFQIVFKGIAAFIFPFLLAVVPLRAQTNNPVQTATNNASLSQADLHINEWKKQDFLAFDPHYKEEKAACDARIRGLARQVIQRERDGRNVGLSHQIVFETYMLAYTSADFKKIDRRLEELQESLDHPEREIEGDEENPADGSWGKGYTQWVWKLSAFESHFEQLRQPPKYPPIFLDRLNSPEKLTNYFIAMSVSDIARTGEDHLMEYNEALSVMLRLLQRDPPPNYNYDPQLKDTLIDLLLQRLRNPATGYWGERYVHNGRVEFADDLSITFHTISYLHGNVPDLDKVMATTLAIKNLDAPVGWLYKGQYWNHNNMDVVELFKWCWPHATDAQKNEGAAEIQKMLHWCLTESLQPDGSFKFREASGSIDQEMGYSISFLARIGYFDKSRRFWTSQDFPDAENVRQKILSYIKAHFNSGATGGEYYKSALEDLNYNPVRDGTMSQ